MIHNLPDDLTEAGRLIREWAVHRMPMVQGVKPVGIISIGELVVEPDPSGIQRRARWKWVGVCSCYEGPSWYGLKVRRTTSFLRAIPFPRTPEPETNEDPTGDSRTSLTCRFLLSRA